MFPSRSSEIERLYNEHGPKELSKRDFQELVSYAIKPSEEDSYPFLYVDCFAPTKSRFRRGFTNVLEIHDDDEVAVEEEQPRGKRGKKRIVEDDDDIYNDPPPRMRNKKARRKVIKEQDDEDLYTQTPNRKRRRR